MARSKVLQFCLLISFVVISTHALKVLLTDGKKRGFKHETEINVRIDRHGWKQYDGCVINKTFTPKPATTNVIVYVKSYITMKRTTLRKTWIDKRKSISETLSARHSELLYLGVKNFLRGEESIIAEFLLDSINRPNIQIYTIGENDLDSISRIPLRNLDHYQEDEDVYEGQLKEELRSMNEGYIR